MNGGYRIDGLTIITMADDQKGLFEYVTLHVDSGLVKYVSPKNAQTDTVGITPGNGVGIEIALNKMAEYDYELVPGIVIPWNAFVSTLIMRRAK